MLHDLAALGQGPAAELAGDLRALCERWRDHLRVIAIDQSEALFTGTELGSSFLALSHEYRLDWWEAGRVEQHAKDSELRPADADRSDQRDWFAKAVLLHTGGAPLLVEDLVRRIKDYAAERRQFGRDHLARGVRDQRAAPPTQTRFWQEYLRAVLGQSEELVFRLRAYVVGQSVDLTREVPPGVERPLFVGGWVREREDGRWGIASTFHASLARAVLDDLPEPLRPATHRTGPIE